MFILNSVLVVSSVLASAMLSLATAPAQGPSAALSDATSKMITLAIDNLTCKADLNREAVEPCVLDAFNKLLLQQIPENVCKAFKRDFYQPCLSPTDKKCLETGDNYERVFAFVRASQNNKMITDKCANDGSPMAKLSLALSAALLAVMCFM